MTELSYVRADGPGALDARPLVILAAVSEAARQRGARTIEAAGFRVATLPFDGTLDAALDRLALQASASALWIELDAGTGADFHRLLDRANAEAAAGRFPAIVAAPGRPARPARRAARRRR